MSAIVKNVTTKYWNELIVCHKFVTQNIELAILPDGTQDVGSKISADDLYIKFKLWFCRCFPECSYMTKREFIGEMSVRWNRSENECWYGIKFKSQADTE